MSRFPVARLKARRAELDLDMVRSLISLAAVASSSFDTALPVKMLAVTSGTHCDVVSQSCWHRTSASGTL